MKDKRAARIEKAAARVVKLLSSLKNWERCDKETGAECRGLRCEFPEHQAVIILENALRS